MSSTLQDNVLATFQDSCTDGWMEARMHVAMNIGLAAIHTIQDLHSYSSIRVLSDCQSLINTLSGGPARQPNSVCNSIWSHLSTTSTNFTIHVQWIPSHIGLPGNTLAHSLPVLRSDRPGFRSGGQGNRSSIPAT